MTKPRWIGRAVQHDQNVALNRIGERWIHILTRYKQHWNQTQEQQWNQRSHVYQGVLAKGCPNDKKKAPSSWSLSKIGYENKNNRNKAHNTLMWRVRSDELQEIFVMMLYKIAVRSKQIKRSSQDQKIAQNIWEREEKRWYSEIEQPTLTKSFEEPVI